MHNNIESSLSFSIKSQLGSASTLLNAGEATNIKYMVKGSDITEEICKEINNISGHNDRMQRIIDKGYILEYSDIEHQTFKNNLIFLDCCMPELIAHCLRYACFPGQDKSVCEVVKTVAKDNPFNFCSDDIMSFYEHKMKVLLLDVALGMTPGKTWKGRYDANGGYLVVKEDGDIVCYHFYNRNDIEDYLYNNTRFELASRSRYHYGYLYKEQDGNTYIKLNLQIRFNK